MLDEYRAEVLRCKAFAHYPVEQNVSSELVLPLKLHFIRCNRKDLYLLCICVNLRSLASWHRSCSPGFLTVMKRLCLPCCPKKYYSLIWLCGVWPRETQYSSTRVH